jgi:hypothetical protein
MEQLLLKVDIDNIEQTFHMCKRLRHVKTKKNIDICLFIINSNR